MMKKKKKEKKKEWRFIANTSDNDRHSKRKPLIEPRRVREQMGSLMYRVVDMWNFFSEEVVMADRWHGYPHKVVTVFDVPGQENISKEAERGNLVPNAPTQ